MRILGKLLVAVVVGSVLAPTSVQAEEACIPINATARERFDDVAPDVVWITGEIIGGGILHGTTFAIWNFTGFDPNTGTVTFEGGTAIFTKNGTLFLSSKIVLDPNTGEYRSNSTVTGGTGRFTEATGALVFKGSFLLGNSINDEQISGEICVQVP